MANIDTLGIGYIKTDEEKQDSPILDLFLKSRIYPFSLLTFHHGTVRSGPIPLETGHSHDVYHMVLFTGGENRFIFRNEKHRSEPGCLVLTRPGEPHDFSPLDTGAHSYHELTFTLKNGEVLNLPFEELLGEYTGRNYRPADLPAYLDKRAFRWALLLFESLKEELGKEEGFRWFSLKKTILEIFQFLSDEVYDRKNETPQPEDGVLLVRNYLDRRFRDPVTIAELAERAGCSPEHLCRRFKKQYALSPMAYRRKKQLGAARNLLDNSALSCKEIAHGLGFSDVYAFSRAFKKETGLSPTGYRKGKD